MIQAILIITSAIYLFFLLKKILSGSNQETIEKSDTTQLLEQNQLTLDEQIKVNELEIEKNAEKLKKEVERAQNQIFDEVQKGMWGNYNPSNPNATVSNNQSYGKSPLKGISGQLYTSYYDAMTQQVDYADLLKESSQSSKINFFSSEQKKFLGKLVNSTYFHTLDKSEQTRIKKFLEIRLYSNTDREFLNKIREGYIKSKTGK